MLDWISHVRAGANELLFKRLSAGVSSVSHFLEEREKALAEGKEGSSLDHLKGAYQKYSEKSGEAHNEFMQHVRSYKKDDASDDAEVKTESASPSDAKTGTPRQVKKS
jgi:hypothetical protein